MRSLCHLDAHFNELRGLPFAIGRLTNLETLNLSSNFSDLTELPETIGDLTNLRELDLSNNQIQALPDTFGRLDNLIKLNLDQNPLVIPPMEVVNEGVEAVKVFMAKRWLEILVEEEQKSLLEVKEQTQTGWLTRSTSWLGSVVSGVSQSVSGYLGPGPRDPYLDQQLWSQCALKFIFWATTFIWMTWLPAASMTHSLLHCIQSVWESRLSSIFFFLQSNSWDMFINFARINMVFLYMYFSCFRQFLIVALYIYTKWSFQC